MSSGRIPWMIRPALPTIRTTVPTGGAWTLASSEMTTSLDGSCFENDNVVHTGLK
ncbi:hypothetical protein DPMN_010173 [Dreissena polymorpha]|uniref:Uncharacterized protein n=1 Tax=Dreissena polymorpha TaxID=45954 RepID=A0A9D4S1A3_DREPO|nr:hypothetical protein DPMN_010173 [Dreissena polymorpha]